MSICTRIWPTLLGIALLLASGCAQTSDVAAVANPVAPAMGQAAGSGLVPTPTLAPTRLPSEATPAPKPTQSPTATAVATPFYSGPLTAACGTQLPILPTQTEPATTALTPDTTAVEQLEAILPPAAKAAFSWILAHPESIGLAIYRFGDEANGVFLNADTQMPLASVVKVIILAAYAEAVAAGELDPLTPVPLADLDAYYLPGTDLGTHTTAIDELRINGRIYGSPEVVALEELPWMMIRHSSNAATDYLHMLLGQERIEATAVALGLTTQTAPCPFLGQFLAINNHTRLGIASNLDIVRGYLADPAVYGREVSLLTNAYAGDPEFRTAERAYREANRGSFGGGGGGSNTQRTFTGMLNAQATPRDYAALMTRFALNGLSNPDSSFIARRYLEWPMRFETNQAVFTNLGYKNGSLPGILTTVYYAYPRGEAVPVVVALFYRDLPMRTYQTWRSQLPHDELARWLLAEPEAIPALRAVLQPDDN